MTTWRNWPKVRDDRWVVIAIGAALFAIGFVVGFFAQ